MRKNSHLLIGLLFAACGVLSAPAQTDPAVQKLAAEVREKGWIVYSARSERGDWDLFACRPDGSGVRNMTSSPQVSEFSPQFSRDNRRLLYRRIPKGEVIDNNRHGTQGELVLAKADGSEPRVLSKPGEMTWASWSPDGNQIACLTIKGVFIYNLEPLKEVRRLDRKGFFQQVTWSPDGKSLVGVANSFGTGWSIAKMDLATGSMEAVNRVDCCTPDWFPDSHEVIFSWRPNGQKANKGYGWTQLWRVDAKGKSRSLVYGEDGRHVYGGHVSPDGTYVLFTGNMEEDGDPNHAGGPMSLMRLGDGPIIGGESKELRAMHPDVKNGPVLQLPQGWEPCWTAAEIFDSKKSPSGSATQGLRSELKDKGWLVFSARSPLGDWELFLQRPDGSGRHNLTATAGINEGGARFSPDGKHILYYRASNKEPLDNNTYGTWELEVCTTNNSTSRSFGKRAWACWGPDGKQLACLTAKSIQIFDAETGQTIREMPRKGMVQQLEWSPDGKRFVATCNGLGPYWNIGVMDAASGMLIPVSETERYNCTPDWTPDSKSVVYARGIIPQQPGRAELWIASADGSSRQRIYSEKVRHIYGACASPDGNYIVFTRSAEDLGKVPEIEMAVIRMHPAPGNDDTTVARIDIGEGWEPHWAAIP